MRFERVNDVLPWRGVEEGGGVSVVTSNTSEDPETIDAQRDEVVPALDDAHWYL